MSISMYEASVPQFIRMLNNLDAILAKAQDHAQTKNFDPSVLLSARLFPDMFPLVRQVQIACDFAKGAAARLAGVDMPKYDDAEHSLAELRTRVAKTRTYLEGFSAAQIDGTEERDIAFTIGGHQLAFKGMPYLLAFVLPNFYFHLTTTYDILRHNGIELGKRDFVGEV